ncbi:dimethylarginine dimethylaminohydrolase family protein [Anaerosporobacter sp.]|uniref:dimethylarginine dimethylaminohydrolase family protein n=1 Tax=Anaerosporobacter sp. TaxID=1872529 RepID=UPI00286F45B8|nr:arginine deiminase family protein [Anaerosporobacter sp.]
MPNKAHGGNGWNARDNSVQEIGTIWNYCGVHSETDDLKSVLLRRPGTEIENIQDPEAVLWNDNINATLAREQHDLMAEAYKKYNVKIHYITDEASKNYPNIYFVRDLFTMTPCGAIISRMASPVRAGEEVIVQNELARLNIPIIASGFGFMWFEGPDIIIVNKDLVFLGIGLRTNNQAIKYIRAVLETQGFGEVIELQTTYGCGHLDGVVNILNDKYAVVVAKRFSYIGYEALVRHGFKIIELTDEREIDIHMAINFVQLNKETVLINKNAKATILRYEKLGIKCEGVDVSELMNGGGSVHCMTGILQRG